MDYYITGSSGAVHDGKDGIFRAIVANGKIVRNILAEQKKDVYCKDGEIGYLLLTDCWSKGIMTEAVRQICDVTFAELDIIRAAIQYISMARPFTAKPDLMMGWSN